METISSEVCIMNIVVKTPVGNWELVGDAQGLASCTLTDAPASADAGALQPYADWLHAYFAGEALPLPPLSPQGTPFQRRVWHALQQIPYGEAISYKQLASNIGQPKAVRAVGTANGRNPLPIFIPCHRVVAHDGGLGGYSLGLELKQWLLSHEQVPSYETSPQAA